MIRTGIIGVVLGLALGLAACSDPEIARLNRTDTTDIRVDGSRLFIDGQINRRAPRQVLAALNANPQVRTIVFGEVPGSVDDEANLRLGHALRDRGLDTHVSAGGYVASGGVDLFLAGTRRTIGPGAILGVHSWADGWGDGRDVREDHPLHDDYTDYTRRMLGSESFYWFTLDAAPSTSVHYMSPGEIALYGLVTG